MNEDKVNEVVDKYERQLAAIQERHIKAIALGFVGDVCTTSIFSILIHCMQNAYIFTDAQLDNLNDLIYIVKNG